jgi:hypothetical protein
MLIFPLFHYYIERSKDMFLTLYYIVFDIPPLLIPDTGHEPEPVHPPQILTTISVRFMIISSHLLSFPSG